MIKRIVKKMFSLLGFSIIRKINSKNNLITSDNLFTSNELTSIEEINPFEGYDLSKEGNEAVKLTKDNSMMPAINLFTLYEQAVYCEKKEIEGSFVECGVWKGGAVGVMAKANLKFGKIRRPIHLFDAFDDICAPNASKDGQKAIDDMKKFAGITDAIEMQGQLIPVKGTYDFLGGHGTIDACKNLLEEVIKYPSECLHFHKGWFQNTIPQSIHQIDKIAILRLDGDWYDSIKVCLDYLFNKVVAGGLVIIDDYGYYDGCTKAVDEFLLERNIKTFLSYSSIGCRYFVKS